MDWATRYADTLGVTLTDDEVTAVLDLARVVAHGTERRNAPVASYLAGRFVADQVHAGVPVDDAVRRATAAAHNLL